MLRRAGHSLEEVAKLAGVSQKSVQRGAAESPVTAFDTLAERVRCDIGRPSKAEAFRGLLVAELAKQPGVRGVELLRRARLAGYAGGKSALYELIAAIRPREPVQPLVCFEGLPGEFSQHDFGEVDVEFGNGTARRVHFFASRLKYSRWAEVSLVPDERVEALVRSLVDHFAAMGGIPLLAVFDRSKTVALAWRRDGVVTEWNPTFAGVVLDLGLGIEVCWPYSPRQKGAVENLVGWVKGSFFKQRRFLDEEDLRRQLTEWHEEVNVQRPSRATGVPPAMRMPEERARLRPLKVSPEELALRFPVRRSSRTKAAPTRCRPRRSASPGRSTCTASGRGSSPGVSKRFIPGNSNRARARCCPNTARSSSPPSPGGARSATSSASICLRSAGPPWST